MNKSAALCVFAAYFAPACLLAGLAPRDAFGQQDSAAMTIDYLDENGTKQRTPSRIGYDGDVEVAYCEAAATDGTTENATVQQAFVAAYRAARPWDKGSLELRCDGHRFVPFNTTATPVVIEGP